MKTIIILLAITISPLGYAGEIWDVFGSGVFDTEWAQSIDTVKSKYPKGKNKNYGGMVQLEVKDDRKVLGVKRHNDDKIAFSFDSESRLSGVIVYYKHDAFGELLNSLNTLFGPHAYKDTSFGSVAEWPIDDGIKISLMAMNTGYRIDVMFAIENQALDKPRKSKKELGF